MVRKIAGDVVLEALVHLVFLLQKTCSDMSVSQRNNPFLLPSDGTFLRFLSRGSLAFERKIQFDSFSIRTFSCIRSAQLDFSKREKKRLVLMSGLITFFTSSQLFFGSPGRWQVVCTSKQRVRFRNQNELVQKKKMKRNRIGPRWVEQSNKRRRREEEAEKKCETKPEKTIGWPPKHIISDRKHRHNASFFINEDAGVILTEKLNIILIGHTGESLEIGSIVSRGHMMSDETRDVSAPPNTAKTTNANGKMRLKICKFCSEAIHLHEKTKYESPAQCFSECMGIRDNIFLRIALTYQESERKCPGLHLSSPPPVHLIQSFSQFHFLCPRLVLFIAFATLLFLSIPSAHPLS